MSNALTHRDPQASYVRIPGLDGLRAVMLRYAYAVVVEISHSDDLPEGVTSFGALDLNGDGLAYVPLSAELRFYDEDQALQIMACEQIDQDLLRYAHG